MIDITVTRKFIIPQNDDGRVFASALAGGFRDRGTFKSRTDSTVAITIVEEYQMTCEVNNDADN